MYLAFYGDPLTDPNAGGLVVVTDAFTKQKPTSILEEGSIQLYCTKW